MVQFARNGIHLKYLPASSRILLEGTVENRTEKAAAGKVTLVSELFETLSWEVTLPQGSWHFARTVELIPCEKWSIDNPRLYDVSFRLDSGAYSVEENIRYGIRSFGIGDDFLLNGIPQKLKGFCDQSPEEVKKAGGNLIRSCGKPFAQDLLDRCDELGILVIEEFDLSLIPEHEIGNAVLRDRSHPCIILWNIENGSDKTAELIRLIDTERQTVLGLTGTVFEKAFF